MLRAITVCVGYDDYLAVTAPLNRHHFSEFWVVTDLTDDRTAAVAAANGCTLFRTDAFTRGGAKFAKWAALEEGLTAMGRQGWLTILDADVVWPSAIRFVEVEPGARVDTLNNRGRAFLTKGHLLSPFRRMMTDFNGTVPPEAEWRKFPVHRNVNEWAGYSQIFHSEDPALGPPPWHETSWVHCGGADSIFQRKWPAGKKVRPPWEVLHLGIAGRNWYGRATRRVDDGTVPPETAERLAAVDRIWAGRRAFPAGTPEEVRFAPEKLAGGGEPGTV